MKFSVADAEGNIYAMNDALFSLLKNPYFPNNKDS